VAGSVGDDPFDPDLPEPADRIGDQQLVADALTLVRRWRQLTKEPAAGAVWKQRERAEEERRLLEQARELLVRVKANNPRGTMFEANLGIVEVELGNYEAAIAILERALTGPAARFELHARLALARAYLAVGRGDAAAAEIERVVAVEPGNADRYYLEFAQQLLEAGERERAHAVLTATSALVEDGSPEQRWLREQLERIEAE